ncbi:hypothetical protein [Methanobrevibacter filiformis]|uniref:Uncharacterized protein n=1 Tax=Methanobrevibacter filiformis TaxID=55758 RepID=A0A166FAL8_9EURY|nr:hypothetical protein [Methanobrevibacter filiformis]KZX17473.1 hypothetical protein MBFIL_01310 [Methanobrevibacter filiformis]
MALKISTLIKQGKKDKLILKIDSLNDTIEASPLSRRQWGEVEDIESQAMGEVENIQTEIADKKGFRSKSKKDKKLEMAQELRMKMSISEQIVSSREAQTRAIYLSLSPHDSSLEEDQIQDLLNKEQFDEIYDKILDISGIVQDEEEANELGEDLKRFPKD